MSQWGKWPAIETIFAAGRNVCTKSANSRPSFCTQKKFMFYIHKYDNQTKDIQQNMTPFQVQMAKTNNK